MCVLCRTGSAGYQGMSTSSQRNVSVSESPCYCLFINLRSRQGYANVDVHVCIVIHYCLSKLHNDVFVQMTNEAIKIHYLGR